MTPLPDQRGDLDLASGPPTSEVEALPIAYLVFARGRLLRANPAARALLGIAVAGVALADLLPAGELDALERASRRTLGGWSEAIEASWRVAAAPRVRTLAHARRGGRASEELHLLVQACVEPRDSREELRLLRSDVDALQAFGRLGRYELRIAPEEPSWYSAGVYAILGRDPARGPLSREAYADDVIHPDDRDAVLAEVARAIATRTVYQSGYRIRRPDGSLRHVRSLGEPMIDEGGRVVGLRGTLMDVTDLVTSATELQHQGAWLSAILDAAVDAIILIDATGSIRSVNPAAQRLFGWAASEMRGRDVSMLMPAPYASEHDGYLRSYLATGVRKIIGSGREVVGLRKDGTTFPMDLTVSEVRLGEQRMFSGFVRDVSERKRLEAEFLQSQKAEAVGRLSQGIAHDFNNLLMGIRSCAQLAREELRPGERPAELVRELEEATERGIALTRRLLAFSRNRPVQLLPVRVGDVVAANVAMWQRLLGEDVELDVRCAPADDVVLGDPGLIEQVLVNLVVNARDAMPRGGKITIETSLRRRPGDPRADRRHARASEREVVLQVGDEGCGMDLATQARIFEPFFTTKDPAHGTGLGLSTVRRIVDELSGTIEVESAPGAGATFRIALPACATGSALPGSSQPPETRGTPCAGTLLLVEDEALIRFALKDFLGKQGFRVLAAADSAAALELAAGAHGGIDALVSDVVLPGIGGRELADRLRAGRPTLPCIFMSAHEEETLVEQGRLERGAHYLEKPFDLPALGALLRLVLGQGARGG